MPGFEAGATLVRNGTDVRLEPRTVPGEQRLWPQHTFLNVYREMMLVICREYPGLPDVRTLTATEVRIFYDGLRSALKQHTKPRPSK